MTKRHRISVVEKGKAPLDSVVQGKVPAGKEGSVPLGLAGNFSNASARGSTTVGGRSFATVTAGLPDLSVLPRLVVEGGVIRVVIPYVAIDKQLEKYKIDLDRKDFHKGIIVADLSRVLSEQWSVESCEEGPVMVDNPVASTTPIHTAVNTSRQGLGVWADVVDDTDDQGLEEWGRCRLTWSYRWKVLIPRLLVEDLCRSL
ncbi:hypothetical protein NE237_003458 [Protea cynaroides]|uniref:Uncharacterized protein n=1 Tax=Protea cynaroides TaxID=273540 RepID=A0A9Q0KHH7_9MAGN|nr:hypothetical protein NE237_003458 [Protea cynaroides]